MDIIIGGRGVCHGGTPALPCNQATICISQKVLLFAIFCAQDIIHLAFTKASVQMDNVCLLNMNIHAFLRKALAVVAAVLVAGGGVAYHQASQRRYHNRASPAINGNASGNLVKESNESKKAGSKRKQKRGGLKNVKAIAAILLAHIGRRGLDEFLALAAIAVSLIVF